MNNVSITHSGSNVLTGLLDCQLKKDEYIPLALAVTGSLDKMAIPVLDNFYIDRYVVPY